MRPTLANCSRLLPRTAGCRPTLPARISSFAVTSLRLPRAPAHSRFSTSRPTSAAPTSGSDSASSSEIPIKELSPREYETVSEQDMESMHERLEVLCEDFYPTWEVEYSSGVMTLSVPPNGIYVINKQPPNQQIWISSPLSGPARFGYSPDGVWVHHRRKGVTLGGILSKELKGMLGDRQAEWDGVGIP